MKKILLVTRPISPPWDEGSKVFAFYLAKNTPGFKFGLLTNGILPNLPENIIQKPIYQSNHFGLWQKMQLLFNLKKLKKEFDILHFLFTPTNFNSLWLKNLTKNSNIKTIQTVATLREDLYTDSKIKSLLFSDWIITYSDYAKNKLNQLGFSNVERIYPGIDLNEYRKKEKNPNLMQKYGFHSDDFIINFTGEYSRLGAIDDVVAAFAQIAPQIPQAKLSLAVRIKNTDDQTKKIEIQKKLKKLNLLDRVAFHDDGTYLMPDIYNLCDLSIFPVQNMQGKFDIPLAIIEAMACEKPIIISDLPILKEIAKDNNSVIIKAGDVKQLAEKILELYHSQDRRLQLGLVAKKFTQENFDIQKIAREYQALYQKICQI
jgi:glycosyltransferase involved in cell wall biosynthesis